MTKSLHEAFCTSMLNRPSGSLKEARDHFRAQMKSDPAYFEMLARESFDRLEAAYDREDAD